MTISRTDPFTYGKLLGKWGTAADANLYRFSSKEFDCCSGLYYYLHRYYDPNLQRWLNQDPIREPGFELLRTTDLSVANGLDMYQCPSYNRRATMKVKMAGNEPNRYGFVQNAPIERIDPFGLWATLDASGQLGCNDQANDLNNAWQAAKAVIQQALDNNNIPSWSGALFDDMSTSKTRIGISCAKCNLYRDFVCGRNGNTANINSATGTVELCSSFFSSSSCQQAEILAVEISKLDNGVTAPSGEENNFAGWLNRRLCNR